MYSFLIKTGTLSAIAVCLVSGQAKADSTSTNNAALSGTSTAATSPSTKKSAPLPITISDYSMIQGPSVSDLKVGQASDDAIGAVQPLSSRQYLSARYLLNSQMSIGPVLDFTYNFNTIPGAEKGIIWNDSFLTFRYNDLLNTKVGKDDLTGALWVNYYAPTSHGSRLNSSMGEMAVWFNPTYQFHGSRWSLSAYDFVKFYGNTRADDLTSGGALRRWTAYAGPQVNYEVNDKLTLFVLYEANLRLYTNGLTDTAFNPGRSLTDVEPGVMWSVSKNITLFPYLNWFLNQSIDTTSIGLNANIKFL